MSERVEPEEAISSPVAAVGEALLARGSDRVVRSVDGGRTWAPVELPGRPAGGDA